MAGEDLGSWVGSIDMPKSSGNQCRLRDSQCLEDRSTFDPHCHFSLEVEWGWLNPCSEAIDMAFIDPSFADWALGKGQWGIDEDFTHRPHPFPFPLL